MHFINSAMRYLIANSPILSHFRRLSGHFCTNNYWFESDLLELFRNVTGARVFTDSPCIRAAASFTHTHTRTHTQIPQRAISSFKRAHRRLLLPIIRNQDQTLKNTNLHANKLAVT